MRESLFSPLWYRVAEQHPHLRAEVRVQRQRVRGQRWYLLISGTTGKQFRVNQKAYEFIGRCDGERTVQRIWDELLEQFRDDAPTQDEVIGTLNQLAEQDLLAHEHAPDAQALVRRRDERAQRKVQGFVNPFAMRVPLGDPSALLQRLERVPALLFNRITLCVWLVAIVIAAAAAASYWTALTAEAASYMGTPRHLLLAWLVFPLLKALHELGHALAVRRWGGEVHEAGFSLFVLVPAPYVDASAAAAFAARRHRIIVSAAGIMVELTVAALALALWVNVEPGLLRDLAFVTAFIAGASTLVFNGNPLLRFDGYYMLCDALDLPNLDTRSKAWWGALLARAFGAAPSASPIELAAGELKWVVAYAPLSFVYRLSVSVVLVIWLGSYSTLLGVAAALLLGFTTVVKPTASAIHAAWTASAAAHAQRRAVTAAAAVIGVAIAAVGVVPFPFHTVASGVVWPTEQARVRPGTDGFIAEVLARDGDRVSAGQVLVTLEEPALYAEREKLAQRLEQLNATRYSALGDSAETARNVEEDIVRVQAELARADERIAELEVRAHTAGVLVMPHQQDLPGTFVRQGSTLAYIVERADVGVRAAIPENDAALVRESTRSVDVRMAGDGETWTAQLVRDIPSTTHDLPSAALGDRGGGSLPTDPADKEGLRARDPVVVVDLKLPDTTLERIGARAWVRFDHGPQPLAARWYRQVRQAFLQHFNPAG